MVVSSPTLDVISSGVPETEVDQSFGQTAKQTEVVKGITHDLLGLLSDKDQQAFAQEGNAGGLLKLLDKPRRGLRNLFGLLTSKAEKEIYARRSDIKSVLLHEIFTGPKKIVEVPAVGCKRLKIDTDGFVDVSQLAQSISDTTGESKESLHLLDTFGAIKQFNERSCGRAAYLSTLLSAQGDIEGLQESKKKIGYWEFYLSKVWSIGGTPLRSLAKGLNTGLKSLLDQKKVSFRYKSSLGEQEIKRSVDASLPVLVSYIATNSEQQQNFPHYSTIVGYSESHYFLYNPSQRSIDVYTKKEFTERFHLEKKHRKTWLLKLMLMKPFWKKKAYWEKGSGVIAEPV